jgi:citrate synthase
MLLFAIEIGHSAMKIGSQHLPTTKISTSNASTIVVRGYDLAENLIGNVTFTDHVWLLVAGELPSNAQRQILDAVLVAIAEHGVVPSIAAARMTLAAAPESVPGAVAAGLLGCGSVILGASDAAGRLFDEVLKRSAGNGMSIDDAARIVLGEYRAARKLIAGYGHSVHKGVDPRAQKLMELSRRIGIAGRYVEIANAVERAIPDVLGKSLSMNVSGAIPSALLDAGYPLLALRGVPLLARTASLIGHLLEEQQHPIGFILADGGASVVRYEGRSPVGFVAD